MYLSDNKNTTGWQLSNHQKKKSEIIRFFPIHVNVQELTYNFYFGHSVVL